MGQITTIFRSGYQILTAGSGGFDGSELSTTFGGEFQASAEDGGGGPSGPYVASWMGRSGMITALMVSADIASALGYVPANPATIQYSSLLGKPTLFDGQYSSLSGKPALFDGQYASLAGKPELFDGLYTSLVGTPTFGAVAFSNSYDDLVDKPFIPQTYGDVNAASEEQGALAETAVQPAALAVAIDTRVEKVNGYGLSQENFTSELRTKLESFVQYDKGNYLTEEALRLAIPVGQPGWKATIDPGTGVKPRQALWDFGDNDWVVGGEAVSATPAEIKSLYESNADTWAFDTAAKAKLSGIQAEATKNVDTDSLPERATNPVNLWFTAARVRAVVATGLSIADATAAAATDTVLVILGKLQRQINDVKQSITDLGTSINTALSSKVDKVNGKQLSTNDYDAAAVSAVASIPNKVDKDGTKVLSTNDYTTGEKNKLSLVQDNATANSSDANLLNRANHTGYQGIQTLNRVTSAIRYATRAAAITSGRGAAMPCLDVYSTKATAAWGLTKMYADYSGMCVTIRRSSDNAEKDFGFAADGVVDVAAIKAWQFGTAAVSLYLYVTKLWDQTGGGFHLTQTGAVSTMPQLDMMYARNGMPEIVCNTGRWLDIPVGVSITSTQNCTVFAAIGNYSPRSTATVWSLGATNDYELALTMGTAYSVTPKSNNVALQFTEGLATVANSNGCVVGLTSTASEMRYFVNNRQYTRAAVTAGNTKATTGGKFAPTGPIGMYGMAVYNTGVVRADCMAIQAAMSHSYRCVYDFKAQLVLVGDSITDSAADFKHNYNKELWNYFGLDVAIYNISLSGQRLQQEAAEVTTRATGLYKANMINVAINLAGVNDITNLRTAAQVYADAQTWHAAMKGAGFDTAQGLLYARAVTGSYTSAMQTERIATNLLFRANTGVGQTLGLQICDFEQEPLNLPNILTTRFFLDNLHLNYEGYKLNTPYIASAAYALMAAA